MTPSPEPTSPDGFDLLEQVRAEAGHLPAVAELLRHADRWIEDASTLPLQTYLKIPATPARRSRYRRDKWLTLAAREIDASGPYTGAQQLKAELDHFLSRGPWFAWRDGPAPPEGATPLRAALFWVAKFNDGDDLTARRLQTIVGSVWSTNFRRALR